MLRGPTAWVATHRRSSVALAVVVVLAVGAGWWLLDAHARAAKVSASWTLDCPAGELDTYHGNPEIKSRAGWRCDVLLRVRNRGTHSIHVSHVESAYLGAAGGAEVRSYANADATLDAGARPGSDSMDGGYDVDVDVPAHAARTIDLAIGWRQHGCDGGGHLWFGGWPTVVFETMHRTFRYDTHQALHLHTYTDPHDSVACPD